jgi:uncharacterized protein (TIGR02646 family)
MISGRAGGTSPNSGVLRGDSHRSVRGAGRFRPSGPPPGPALPSRHPATNLETWRSHSYWRRIGSKLHAGYGGICAYSCHWIPYDTGADTVEHFRPKDTYPAEAYEWANYRLVCATLNGRKGAYEDVLDPFQIENGWFVIDFPSMLVKPSSLLAPGGRQDVQATIDRLGLNDEGTCLKSRVRWLTDYCLDDITLDYLRKHAPFIVAELERQDLVATIREVFNVCGYSMEG